MDQRNQQLAKNLVNYSCNIQKGERVFIESKGVDGIELMNCVINEVYAAGGLPFARLYSESVDRALLLNISDEQLKLMAKLDGELMDNVQAYIGIRASSNSSEMSDVPQNLIEKNMKLYNHPVHHNIRVKKTKWVVMRYPNASMAQLANTSQQNFANYYYDVCNLDYAKMSRAMQPLKQLMEKTDRVRITAPGTDLTFSIKNIGAVPCDGHMNIPDGEIYSAPVRNSVNGTILYNAPSFNNGFVFENVSLTFKDGKIINATANDSARLNKILDTDDGARYVGEFAIGVNPYITKPMKDTLFDEKIAGSIHFTPGSCYSDAYNGNDSAVHWDLILIQTPEFGGGDIYFDDVLIRRDGLFVLPELLCLNPEQLK